MALGIPTSANPPPGGRSAGGGGGGFIGDVVSRSQQPPPNPMSSQQQAALNWLEGASGMNLSGYNSTLSSLDAQRNALNASYGSASGAAGRDYGLTVRGIDQDLMYGNQLREQERYRNVDLGRSRSTADYGNAMSIWDTLRGDIGRRAGFNTRNLNLSNQQVGSQYTTGIRNIQSDAIARGARTSAGTIAQSTDAVTGRTQGLARNRLDFDVTKQGLDTEYKRGSQAYKYAGQQYGIDKKTFDSIAKTYGIQTAQAIAQAALGKERAASNRASAGSAAGAQRAQGLANLAGGQSSAYNQYMQQQMALYSQMLGL